jgi:hypothetical protein
MGNTQHDQQHRDATTPEPPRRDWIEPVVEEHGSLSELIRGFSGPDCDSGGLSACNLGAGDPCSGAAGQCL